MGSKAMCIENMKNFFKRNPSYTVDHVFKARDMYFKSLMKRDGSYTYLQQADSFIKKIKRDGTVIRNLETYCEEVEVNMTLGTISDEAQQYKTYDDI